ncbi:MAG: imidazole glycerol phosphate synthase subunit HisH [Endomicrobiia bacterium]
MIKKVGIINYGVGNLMSIAKAVEFLGILPEIIKKATKKKFDMLILPGVGSFGYAVDYVKKNGLYDIILEFITSKKPVLGICLGMQLLFDKSEEAKNYKGFEILKGDVIKFKNNTKFPVPHMCWNLVEFKFLHPVLLKGLNKKEFFYFVHSYFCVPEDKSIIFGTTNYINKFCSMIVKENIIATQFHLEKSGISGLKLLKNILDYFNTF